MHSVVLVVFRSFVNAGHVQVNLCNGLVGSHFLGGPRSCMLVTCDNMVLFWVPHSLTILENEKAKFKVALRKYWNIHSFSSVDDFFFCVKRIIVLFYEVFVVYYIVKVLYILYSYDLFQVLLSLLHFKDPWNVCTYVTLRVFCLRYHLGALCF